MTGHPPLLQEEWRGGWLTLAHSLLATRERRYPSCKNVNRCLRKMETPPTSDLLCSPWRHGSWHPPRRPTGRLLASSGGHTPRSPLGVLGDYSVTAHVTPTSSTTTTITTTKEAREWWPPLPLSSGSKGRQVTRDHHPCTSIFGKRVGGHASGRASFPLS